LVVKQKRGRKRYILFEHHKKPELGIIRSFLSKNSEILKGKIRWRIIEFEEKNSIILIDHTKSVILRKLIEDNIDKLGLKPTKTSGTLKALRK
tara:strand:- start:200 stop:478 length:279 start_codon:yes stop_codon:yes gene_type:complete